jgi:GTP cyclohydrolase IB
MDDSLSSSNQPNDSAHQAQPQHPRVLAWAGMDQIESMLRLAQLTLPAKARLGVNLVDAHKRGIHMSRLYATLDQTLAESALSLAALPKWLQQLLDSQQGLSDHVELALDFAVPLRQKALRSAQSGWRHYPVQIQATLAERCSIVLGFQLTYSSTCPCSSALARQSIQENFLRQFPREQTLQHAQMHAWLGTSSAIHATPHAQRSHLDVKLQLAPALLQDADADGSQLFALLQALINAVEAQLATPVQTAVKRIDEQAFAELNAQHTMFVEDAVRRVAAWLDQYPTFEDFRVQATHYESLHAHDAQAIAVKGVSKGFRA